ncbi:chemotaxis protein CheX [Simiduia sp. 21SJ11W-1]|uniref:chemotaxis protein CheX n=1 Tax=Simiduia sp. 21SJ11W-1 TaxID=2909669 RepID=UPI0020A0F20A|nr:chemotaxis protein CheX [Simiduia sp. 21SJ11W-1]UTA49326.1 chemotaxis protein CheX [Simiduia sp. 21SJ11W-1]
MNENLLSPFYEALHQVLFTMAQVDTSPGKRGIKKNTKALGIVTGIIALDSKNIKGSMAVSFSQELIGEIFANMLGEKHTQIDAQVCDLVGELTNMITGAAKPALFEMGIDLSLTRPTTVSGLNHQVLHPVQGPVMIQQVNTGLGFAALEVCFAAA